MTLARNDGIKLIKQDIIKNMKQNFDDLENEFIINNIYNNENTPCLDLYSLISNVFDKAVPDFVNEIFSENASVTIDAKHLSQLKANLNQTQNDLINP